MTAFGAAEVWALTVCSDERRTHAAETNGWQAGAPFGPGTANFEVMREWNRADVYRRSLVLFSERLGGG